MEVVTPDTWTMITQLSGGLAIFLFGLDQLTDTLKATAGPVIAVADFNQR